MGCMRCAARKNSFCEKKKYGSVSFLRFLKLLTVVNGFAKACFRDCKGMFKEFLRKFVRSSTPCS